MKQLSIEEKAKAYDEAKSIMEKYLKSGNAGVIAENTIKKAFPELEESEDGQDPIFRVGDYIRNTKTGDKVLIEQLDMATKAYCYICYDGAAVNHSDFPFSQQDEWKLIGHYSKTGTTVEKDMTEYKKGFEFGKQLVLKYPEDFGLCKKSDWLENQSEVPMVEEIIGEDDKIRKELIGYFTGWSDKHLFRGFKAEQILAWLEKQGELDKVAYEIAEKEKREFVGDGFIKCYADFQDFKEGETYWLEYIGNDKYNVRSDNLLGKTYHITPCQLYTIFKKQTWLEKQGEQKTAKIEPKFKVGDKIIFGECDCGTIIDIKDGKYIFDDGNFIYIEEQGLWKLIDNVEPKFKVGNIISDGISEVEIVSIDKNHYNVTNSEIENDANICNWVVYFKDQDNWKLIEQIPADKVEPKFKVGDWIITNKNHIWYVDETPETTSYLYRLINQYGKVEVAEFEIVDKKARLWTVQDAKDGDVLREDSCIFIIEKMKSEDTAIIHCCLFDDGDIDLTGSTLSFDVDSTYPATKEQRDLLFSKMHEAGFEWDSEKKELKKIEQNYACSDEDENVFMTIKELLQNKINDGTICGDDLLIGRTINFGKYKGKYILWLLSKHPFYMKWIIEHTSLQLNDVEEWWKEEVETALLLDHVDSIIYGVGKQVIKHGELFENNPHYIVE